MTDRMTDERVRELEAELARYRDARVEGVDVAALISEATPDDASDYSEFEDGYIAEYYSYFRRDLLTALRYAARKAAEEAAKPEALVWDENGHCVLGEYFFMLCENTYTYWAAVYRNYEIFLYSETHKSMKECEDNAARIARALGLLKETDNA